MKQTLNKWFFIILALTGYILFAKFQHLLIFKDTNIVAFWIPTGISLTILLFKGYKYIPLIFIGDLLVTYFTANYESQTFLSAVLFQVASSLNNVLEAILGLYLITKFSKPELILSSLKNSGYFILTVVLITFINGLIGTFLYCYFNNDWLNFDVIFRSWWISDALGILLITPLLISFSKKIFHFKNYFKILEFIFYLAIIYSFLYALTKTPFHIDYLIFPILLIGLFRFGKFINFITLLFISILIAYHNSGSQHAGTFVQDKYLLTYQLYFSVAIVLILITSALIEDQKSKAKELLKSKTQFQSIFNAINEAILICDKNSGSILDVNNYACEWLGYSKKEFKNMTAMDLDSNTHSTARETAYNLYKKSWDTNQNFKWQIKDKANKK